jgi:CheY-like chemotaxis protein
MKILVVDDERDVEVLFRQRFRREIRSGEIELIFAFSGDEALELLGTDDPADVVLVLSDINMPGMTGIELLRRVKATPPPIPVCIMTAYDQADYRTKATAAGCDAYITKPIDFAQLRDRIRSLVAETQ